jgi:hypothetical protein
VAGLRRHGIAAEAVARIRPDTENVILLDGLRLVPDVTSATTAQRNAFRAARALAGRMAAHGGVFVTVQDTGGDFGLGTQQSARAWIGGLAALARTAAKEWPRAAVKAIDCATKGRSAADVADAIVAELLGGAGAPVVGLRADGTRIVPEPIAQSIEDTATRIGPDSVVVATGGARGVTAACLRLLAARRQPKLVLLGRTPLSAEPPGLAAATDEAGLIALLAAREPGSPSQLADRARARARRPRDPGHPAADRARRRHGPLRLDRRARRRKRSVGRWTPCAATGGPSPRWSRRRRPRRRPDRRDDERTVRPRLRHEGAGPAGAARRDRRRPARSALRLLVGRGGVRQRGQAGYAMANEVLNQVLAANGRAARGAWCARSRGGPWPAVMVTPTIAERFREAGVALIDPDDGARAFLDEIDGPADGVVVGAGGENPIARTRVSPPR